MAIDGDGAINGTTRFYSILKPTKQQEDKNLHATCVHKCSKEIHKIDY